jgi:hypothetical protein
MKNSGPIAALLLLVNICSAQKVTFSGQVAGIIYNNCTGCHRAGNIAPFTLENYSDAYNYRLAIRDAVNKRVMPPWSPNTSYTHFANEKALTAEQIGIINQWLIDGAEQGDITQEPKKPEFIDGPQLVHPDFSMKIPEHTVNQQLDDFEFFSLPSGLKSDAWIKQIELVPGNKKIVHHIFVFIDLTGDFMNNPDFNNNPGSYVSGGPKDLLKLVGGWLPGGSYTTLPENMGFKVPAGSNYIVQIHYAPGSYGQSDATQLNIKYASNNDIREMDMKPLLNNIDNLTDGPLFIPANSTRNFHETFTLESDISLISITPHMHKIGKRLKVYAFAPCSNDTIRLVDDKWDFHWQGIYTFPRPIHLKAGTILHADGFYNNTSSNPDNPNMPPKDIEAGNSTLTEMMQVFFCWTDYQKGDEQISLGGNKISSNYATSCSMYPNPVTSGQELNVSLDPVEQLLSVRIYTMDGKPVLNYEPGFITNRGTLKLPELPNGMYLMVVYNSTTVIRKKFMVYGKPE